MLSNLTEEPALYVCMITTYLYNVQRIIILWYDTKIVLRVPRVCEGSARNHCADCTVVPYGVLLFCWLIFTLKAMGWGLKCWDSYGISLIRTRLLQTTGIHVQRLSHTNARKPQRSETQICQGLYFMMRYIMPSSLHSHETFEFINVVFQ